VNIRITTFVKIRKAWLDEFRVGDDIQRCRRFWRKVGADNVFADSEVGVVDSS
jgi:hypothetical protein